MALHDAAAASAEIPQIDGLSDRLLDGETVLWAGESGGPAPQSFVQPSARPWRALLMSGFALLVSGALGLDTDQGTFAQFIAGSVFVVSLVFFAACLVGVTQRPARSLGPMPRTPTRYAITDRRLVLWDDVRTFSLTGTLVFGIERFERNAQESILVHVDGEEENALALLNIKNSHYAERLLLQLCSEPGRIKP